MIQGLSYAFSTEYDYVSPQKNGDIVVGYDGLYGTIDYDCNIIIDISNEENDFCVSVYDDRKVKMYTSAIFKTIEDAKNKFIELYNTYHNELQVMYCHSYKYYLKF